MVAINEKVIYHVKVWVLEEILCNALGSASLCNQRFLFNPKKEITTVQKVILSNEYKFIYMFGDEFLVQYKGLFTSGMCFFFHEKRVMKMSRSNVMLAHFAISKGHFRSF